MGRTDSARVGWAVAVPPGISADDHDAGMNSSLANLAAFLTRSPRAG